ncbi:hypothetical protein HK096_010860 [Nowakowskiella sp. JEL0078]|nr:hypothetical protein HK096_010860 [Nowakowskiella sp. JEL0078]
MSFGRGGFRGRGRGGWGNNEPPLPPQTEKIDYPSWASHGIQLPPFNTNEREKYFYAIERDMQRTFLTSPLYIDFQKAKPDIDRYSDKYKQKVVSRKSISSVSADLDFFPSELHSVYDPSRSGGSKSVRKTIHQFNLDALADAEEKANARGEGDDDEENIEEDIEDSEGEDENDYVEDHWGDDHDAFDSDGGDGDD